MPGDPDTCRLGLAVIFAPMKPKYSRFSSAFSARARIVAQLSFSTEVYAATYAFIDA